MTNNQKLLAIMAKHKLSKEQLTEASSFSRDTVKSWCLPVTSKAHRKMPDRSFKLILVEIKEKKL